MVFYKIARTFYDINGKMQNQVYPYVYNTLIEAKQALREEEADDLPGEVTIKEFSDEGRVN